MKKTALLLVIVFSIWYLVFAKQNVIWATTRVARTTVASPSATVVPTAVPTAVVAEMAPTRSAPTNRVVKWAIDRGVATNTIVLLLLLPLIATLVSVLHYIFGLSGYGIFMPTMIAVTFLATGIFGGLLLFGMILIISLCSNLILKRLKIHFWPARSINLLFISVGTFGLMVVSSFFKFVDISQISIFPVLFMIMLAEEFVRTQFIKSKSEAKKLTIGTLVLAITGAIAMNFKWVQEIVLRNPEIVILFVLVVNLVVGNYTGIRLSEISRFKKAIRERK